MFAPQIRNEASASCNRIFLFARLPTAISQFRQKSACKLERDRERWHDGWEGRGGEGDKNPSACARFNPAGASSPTRGI